jgi:hypothetical protein
VSTFSTDCGGSGAGKIRASFTLFHVVSDIFYAVDMWNWVIELENSIPASISRVVVAMGPDAMAI